MSFRQDEKSKMCTNNDNVVQVKRHCMETGHTYAALVKHPNAHMMFIAHVL